MITAKRAASIILEPDQEKRDALVDKLAEKDTKALLKTALTVIRKNIDSSRIEI